MEIILRKKKKPFTRFRFAFAGGVCIASKEAIRTRLNQKYGRSMRQPLTPHEWFFLAQMLERGPGEYVPTQTFMRFLVRCGVPPKQFEVYHRINELRLKVAAATNDMVNIRNKRRSGYHIIVRT